MPRTFGLSSLLTLMNAAPDSGSRCPAPSCALAKAVPNDDAPPITSPVDFISGPRIVSTPGKRTNGNTGALTNTPVTSMSCVRPSAGSVSPAISRAAILASGTPRRLGQVRHRARRARVHFEDVDLVVLDGELRVHQADDLERPGDAARVVADRLQVLVGDEVGRDDAGAVARVDAGLLDVLHHAADDDVALRRRRAASTSSSKASSRKRSIRIGRSGEASTALAM